MSIPLLTTKLNMPRPHLDLVKRPLLIGRLNAGLSGKLSLVAAPAGFGKTTLVADWIVNELPENHQERVAWLSLDSADNSPVQFWTYVIAALQMVAPSLGKILQAALHTAAPLPPIESVLTSLINEIVLDDRNLILGLDDYHEITHPEIHAGLAFLIEHLPSNLHLVIVSREDLPFSVSRYRVRGQLTEIRAIDLRFSATDSTAFFNDLLSLSLTTNDIEALNIRTEGWIAGLQLAALSLRSADDKSEFIQAFAGSHRFLTDYLVDEVLSRQTPDIQKFLWRTSILDRFCTDICDELINDGDSRLILRQLEQANLFIIPLDNERRWFRYHHLFAEFLRLRLFENEPEILPELYRRTINWYSQANLPLEALQYALKAEEVDLAAELIETLAPEILEKDNPMLVIQWIEGLPQDLVIQRPYLCAYMGWAYVLAGQMETANRWLVSAENQSDQLTFEDAQIIQGYVLAQRSYILIMQGDYELGIDEAQKALELLPLGETALRARTVSYLGNAYNYCGRLQDAKKAYQEAIAIAQQIGSLSLAMFSYGGIGEIFREEGRLTDALDAYQQLLAFAEKLTGKRELPLTGHAIFEIGVIYREWYDLDKALEQVQKGVNLCRKWQQGVSLGIGLLQLAEIHRLRGEFDKAAAVIEDVRQVAAAISPWATNLVEGIAARLSLSRGDLDGVVQWAENAGFLDEESCVVGYERFAECPALIRMLILTGKPQQALAVTQKLIERDKPAGRMGRVLDLLILQFAALDAMEKTDQALEAVAEAVALASLEKHICSFVDESPRLIPYLQKLPSSPHCNQLLEIFGEAAASKPAETIIKTGLVEPLNERECEILRMMSSGRSNHEIGDELYLSVNTIRWYASQIYSKLGVKNRGEAVARARELGVLKPLSITEITSN